MSLEEEQQRYYDAMHAVQTGVSYVMEYDPDETSHKNLRMGMNSSLLSTSALAQLLMNKGFFTEEEYFKYLANFAEEEIKMYKANLKKRWPNVDIELR